MEVKRGLRGSRGRSRARTGRSAPWRFGSLTFTPQDTGRDFEHAIRADLWADGRGIFTDEGDTGSFSLKRLAKDPPELQSVAPLTGGPGEAITHRGRILAESAPEVFFNGAKAELPVGTETRLTVSVPSQATSGPIVVRTGKGEGTFFQPFTLALNLQSQGSPRTKEFPSIASPSPEPRLAGASVFIGHSGAPSFRAIAAC